MTHLYWNDRLICIFLAKRREAAFQLSCFFFVIIYYLIVLFKSICKFYVSLKGMAAAICFEQINLAFFFHVRALTVRSLWTSRSFVVSISFLLQVHQRIQIIILLNSLIYMTLLDKQYSQLDLFKNFRIYALLSVTLILK